MERAGRYHLAREIAVSDFASVHRAYLSTPAGVVKPVTVRRILAAFASKPDVVDLLLEDARIRALLEHPHIPAVLDLDQHEGRWFLVEERVLGQDLGTLMRRARLKGVRIDVHAALYFSVQILDALAHAHGRTDAEGNALGIVHRDVSPANVLVGFGGEVKLGGFSYAKLRTRPSPPPPGFLHPRHGYVSPEQALGSDVDHRADVFSVGLIAYELLTGIAAYESKTDLESLARAQRGVVRSLEEMLPSLSVDLRELIESALVFDKKSRHASAASFRDELARLLYVRDPTYGSDRVTSLMVQVFSEEAADERAHERAERSELGGWKPAVSTLSKAPPSAIHKAPPQPAAPPPPPPVSSPYSAQLEPPPVAQLPPQSSPLSFASPQSSSAASPSFDLLDSLTAPASPFAMQQALSSSAPQGSSSSPHATSSMRAQPSVSPGSSPRPQPSLSSSMPQPGSSPKPQPSFSSSQPGSSLTPQPSLSSSMPPASSQSPQPASIPKPLMPPLPVPSSPVITAPDLSARPIPIAQIARDVSRTPAPSMVELAPMHVPEQRKSPVVKIAIAFVLLLIAGLTAFAFSSEKNNRLVSRKLRAVFIGRQPGGMLTIETVPPGAKITLDDEDTGRRSPLVVENLESGMIHDLTLVRDDGEVVTATVSVRAGSKSTLTLLFPNAVVPLTITSDPTGAEVWIDNRMIALAPASLVAHVGRETTVRLTRTGYIDNIRKITAERGQPVALAIVMEKTKELQEAEEAEAAAIKAAEEEAAAEEAAEAKKKKRRQP